MDAMQISRTGLDIEWRRLEVIAANLANMGTTRTGSGGAFQPMRLVSGPAADFAAHLDGEGPDLGVTVYGVEAQNVEPRRAYEPGHPHADEDGYVTYPGIDHAAEMTLMIQTSRSYEANLVAMNMARQMYVKALEIGRR